MLSNCGAGRRSNQSILKEMRWLDKISDSMNMNLSKLQRQGRTEESGSAAVHGITKIWTYRLNNNN